MKKSLIAALAASIALTTGTAFAAEVPNPFDIKFDGSINVQYRDDAYDKADVSHNDFKTTFVLNAEKNIAKNLDLYARFTHQSFLNTKDSEFPAARDYINRDYNGKIDAVGLKYSNAGFNYVIGSQSMTFGATGILYDNGIIGQHANPYAITASGKVGATDIRVIGAETNYQGNIDNDRIYAVEGSYGVNDKATVGAVYARVNYGDDNPYAEKAGKGFNYYTVNTSYKLAKDLSFTAEYLKSNADKDNKGYVGGFNYKLDDKNSFGASYWRVEDNAAIVDYNWGSMTTYWSNAKGYTLTWKHKLGEDVTLNVADHNFDKIKDASTTGGANDNRNSFRAGITISF